MFAPSVIATREAFLHDNLGADIPGGRIIRRDPATCWAYRDQLADAVDAKGNPTRPLTTEEDTFISHERLLGTIDFRYWAERWAYVAKETQDTEPIFPLWASQELFLARVGAIEASRHEEGSPDGILVNCLKARQLGASTLVEVILAHGVTNQRGLRGLVAGDVQEQSQYMFGMAETVITNLPWWLKPPLQAHQRGLRWAATTGSSLQAAWGKSARGGLQDRDKAKGNLGRGRSQPLEEPVLTPFGWVRMGDIQPDDLVIGANGRPIRVLGVFPQGEEDVYRVTFTDGAWTECSDNHLWNVTTSYRQWRGQSSVVRTTRELRTGKLRWSAGRVARWIIPTVAPVRFQTKRLPLDPYFVGVVIGDGCLRGGRGRGVMVSARDPEIVERVRSVLPVGYRIVFTKEGDWHIRSGGPHMVSAALDWLGLSGKYSYEKRIPAEYLLGDVAQREALLQGLMDTDGTADADCNRASYSTTSPGLADDVTALVESLGGQVRRVCRPPKPAHTRANGQTIYSRRASFVLTIRLPAGLRPFHLPRKQQRLRPDAERKYFPTRIISSIEYTGRKQTQCIQVDAPDHLYVTRHCVVTHNTYSRVHLSELSSWERPEQINDALLPGVPIRPRVFGAFESTAKGRYDWWHEHWLATEKGLRVSGRRFDNVFIPWYIEPDKYWLPAPLGWAPAATTIAHATAVEIDSPRWCLGRTVRLSREQLYWYESTRAAYDAADELYKFFEEFCSTPTEAFQHAGRSIFSAKTLERCKSYERPPILVRVRPAKDIAQLKQWEKKPTEEGADAPVV